MSKTDKTTAPDSVHPAEAGTRHFRSVLQARLSRRDALRAGFGTTAGGMLAGAGLYGCSSDGSGNGGAPELRFQAVGGQPGADFNGIALPEGYTYDLLIPWGTPILGDMPAFKPDGSNTAAEQAQQSGEWHDGMEFFPIDGSDTNGLLCVNHESLTTDFFHGYRIEGGEAVSNRQTDANGLPTNADQVRKEINGHGVSVVEIQRVAGKWQVVDSGRNRRITAATPMRFSGPAAGSAVLQTAFSPDGTQGRGTLNNCGRGFTPWGTYLTCEENFRGYLTTQEDPVPEEKNRYALNASGFGYRWDNVAGDASEDNGEFRRWDITATADSASADYRNEANHFGWIVEIDPTDPGSTPVKRTALGRLAHEGAQPGRIEAGRPIAFYTGDDDQNEYLFKFVTADAWDPDNPDPDMLDMGTLYVAKFNDDGSGEWIALDIADSRLAARFSSQAEIVTYARIAGDLVEATPMDRPEWSTTDPNTGEIYLTLTNNSEKGDDAAGRNRWEASAANPRDPNNWGHVLRFREDGDDPAATSFTWDIFVFGAPAGAEATINRSGLTADNEFAGPDGLYMDPRGVLWIQTDNGGNAVADATNDQLLAVVPGRLNGSAVTPDNQSELKRMMVGPGRCEVTGIVLTPDARTLFVNIQHPGDSLPTTNSFPASGAPGPDKLPRSTTIAIRREDGGEIAL